MYVNQPTNTPTSKVQAAAAGGALVTIIVSILGVAGVAIPPEVAAAAVTIVAFVAGYFQKERVL